MLSVTWSWSVSQCGLHRCQGSPTPLWWVGRKSCAGQCVGQSRQFHSTVVSGKKELYWAACWSVVPFHCGEWEERVVLGSALVRGSIPLVSGKKELYWAACWSAVPSHWWVGRKSCTERCVGQWFHSTVVSGKKELYWAACWSVVHGKKELYWVACWSAVPLHCGAWEERVVLGSVLVRGSIPLWCMGRRCYTWQCIGQWFHSTVMHGKRAALGSALVSQDGSTPQWFVGSKSCTGQCISQ